MKLSGKTLLILLAGALLFALAANRLWETPRQTILTLTPLQGGIAAAAVARADAPTPVEWRTASGTPPQIAFDTGVPMRLALRGTTPATQVQIEYENRRFLVPLTTETKIFPVKVPFATDGAASALKFIIVAAFAALATVLCHHFRAFPAASGAAAGIATAAVAFGNLHFCRDWDLASRAGLVLLAAAIGWRSCRRFRAFAELLRTPRNLAAVALPTLCGVFAIGFSNWFPSPAICRFDLAAVGVTGVLTLLVGFAVLNAFDLWDGKQPVPPPPDTRKFAAGLFAAVAAVLAVYWWIFFPGIMSPDSFNQWSQAHGWSAWDDVHPAAHTFLYFYLPTRLWDSPGMVVLVQILGTAGVFAAWGVYFVRRGWGVKTIGIALTLFAALPVNGVLAVTLWKDQPFTIALLWLMLELAIFAERRGSGWAFTRMLLAATAVGLLRQNGIIVFLALLIFAAVVTLKRRQWLMAAAALLVGLTVLGGKNPLYRHWNIRANPPSTAFVSAYHDLAGIQYFATPGAPLPKGYFLYAAGPTIFTRTLEEFPVRYGDSPARFAADYLRKALPHPLLTLHLRLIRSNQLWDFAMPERCYSFRSGFFIDRNPYQIELAAPERAATAANIIAKYGYEQFRLLDIAFWRGALGGWIGILVLGYWLLRRNREALPILIPLFGNMLSLLIGAYTQEFRYYYFMPVLGFFLIFCAGAKKVSEESRISRQSDSE